MRIAFGIFLVLHALIHVLWIVPGPDDPKYPFTLDSSRLLSGASPATLRTAGLVLAGTALVAFALAGLGVLGVSGLASIWKITAIAGALSSVALVVVFWNTYFIAGPILDAAIVIAAVMGWPGD